MTEIDCPMDMQGWCRRVKQEEKEPEICRQSEEDRR